MRGQSHSRRKIILGLTGSFGSGKTTVARMFKAPYVRIIDADRLAHSLIKPGTRIYKKIITTFGEGILKRDKTIDRNRLGRLAFSNKNLLGRLNKIIHPEIIRIIKKEIHSSLQEVIVLDAALLIEAGLRQMVDKLIVVKITRDKQIKRVLNKTSLSKTDILKRINAQIPLSDKVRLADFVIDNSGAIEQTKKQVATIRRLLSNEDETYGAKRS